MSSGSLFLSDRFFSVLDIAPRLCIIRVISILVLNTAVFVNSTDHELDSIAVPIFVDILVESTNTVSVSEAKIQITLLIVRRGALSVNVERHVTSAVSLTKRKERREKGKEKREK